MTISTSRRRALAGLGALTILPGARNAHAQAFPAKPIKLIVPHAAGGNSDAFGRILAQRLSDRIGQQ
ncbi:MAG: tripartite tricarboxylate transporter substrate binding protein, partial [Burkholderiaceae bacterium]|nr:tripartite tricarboxylate transporter substrate binding protein [Burkholderiaceae bacterium]